MTTIEHLPPEILSVLFNRLLAAEVHRLVFASGSRALSLKSTQVGCLTAFRDQFSALTVSKITLPSIIFQLQHLLILELHFHDCNIIGLTPEAIKRFPSTIESLSLNCMNALSCWLTVPTNTADAARVAWVSSDPDELPELVNVRSVFPNLRRLSLKTDRWNPYQDQERDWTLQIRAQFLLSMPPTLEHLEMQPMCLDETFASSVMPPNLTSFKSRFELSQSTPFFSPTMHSNLRDLEVRFKHADIHDTVPTFPEALTRLHVGGAFPVPYFFTLPRTLLDLTIDGAILPHSHAEVTIALTPDQTALLASTNNFIFTGLPVGLRRLCVGTKVPLNNEHGGLLPPQLEHLDVETEAKLSNMTLFPHSLRVLRISCKAWNLTPMFQLGTLPPALVEFSMNQTSKFSDTHLGAIPPSVTNLSLQGCGFTLTDAVFDHLPPKIARLVLSTNLITMRAIAENLPPTLHALYLPNHTAFSDSDLLLLPRQLNRFSLGKIFFHGEALPREISDLSIDAIPALIGRRFEPPLRHTISFNSKFRGLPDPFFSQSTTELIMHNPTKYPSTIRKLAWAGTKPPLNQILWMLPNLTELTCDQGVRLDTDKLPHGLTRLRLRDSQPLQLLVNLPENLTDLSLPETSMSSDFSLVLPPHLTHLCAAFVFPSHLRKCNNLEKISFTKARSMNDSHFALLPRSIKSLSIRDLSDNKWGYHTYQSSQKMAITNAHLAHLPPSLTEYLNDSFQLRSSDVKTLPASLKHMTIHSFHTDNLVEAMATISPEETTMRHIAEVIGRSFLRSMRPDLDLKTVQHTQRYYQDPIPWSWSFTPSPELYDFLPAKLRSLHANTTWKRTMLPSGTPGISMEQLSRLPSTITFLDIRCDNPLPHHATHHLPRTLLELKMNGLQFSAQSFADLPRGLLALDLGPVRKFTGKCCRNLPPTLARFGLFCSAAHDGAFEALPATIVNLSLEAPALTNAFLKYLPPNLVTFKCSSKHFTRPALETFLPQSLVVLSIPPGLSIARGDLTGSIRETILIEPYGQQGTYDL